MKRHILTHFLALLLSLSSSIHIIDAAPQNAAANADATAIADDTSATAIANSVAIADGSGNGNGNGNSGSGNGNNNGNDGSDGNTVVANAEAIAIASPPGTVGVESGSVELPAGGFFSTVKTQIDGKEFNLMLDTGSARLYVCPD